MHKFINRASSSSSERTSLNRPDRVEDCRSMPLLHSFVSLATLAAEVQCSVNVTRVKCSDSCARGILGPARRSTSYQGQE